MVGSVPGRLATMMFLQYFGLSAMIVPLTRYLQTPPAAGGLGFAPTHVGYVYMTFAVGAIIAPIDGGDGVFWYVRLTGTFGWIVAGFVVGWGMNPISPQPLYVAAATSAVLAA